MNCQAPGLACRQPALNNSGCFSNRGNAGSNCPALSPPYRADRGCPVPGIPEFLLAPDRSLTVPNFPVIRVIAVINNVTGKADKCRIRRRNGVYQNQANRWISHVCIFWVMKTSIAIRDETERNFYLVLQINRTLCDRPSRAGRQENKRCRHAEQRQRICQ